MGIFKNKGTVKKVVEGIIEGVDKTFFTDEERAQFSKQIADAQLEFLKTTIDESSIRSITRRWLSIGIVAVFLLLLIVAVVVHAFTPDYSDFIFNVAKELNGLVLMVAGFFFGGYMVKSKIAPAFKNK